MKSKLFSLGKSDFAKGAVSALIAGFIFAVGSAVSQSGFSIFSADWAMILDTALTAGVASFVGYVGKNFLTDSEGTLLGSADKK